MRSNATTDDTPGALVRGSRSRERRRTLPLLVLVVAALAGVALRAGLARAGAGEGRADSCMTFDQEHAAWTRLLGKHVRGGVVDYTGWKRAGEGDLDAYLGSLQSVCRGHYDTWTRAQKLAFWINGYNAYTVRLVLRHHPLRSIRDVGQEPGALFGEGFIPMEKLRGRTLSLNDIEHEILRKELREPRIHFAIVCASKGCPALRPEAYRAGTLDRQLDDAARGFLRDETRNRFDGAARTLRLSSIFDWFRDDFAGAAGSVQAFVARYADEPTARAIGAGGVRVEFLDYDWSLNGR